MLNWRHAQRSHRISAAASHSAHTSIRNRYHQIDTVTQPGRGSWLPQPASYQRSRWLDEPLPLMNISGLPNSPAATTPTNTPRATSVAAISATCSRLWAHAGRRRNDSLPRQRRKNNQPITTSASGSGTWVRPIPNSIHSTVRSGERATRPSTQAASSAHTRIVQKRTAGPRTGPRAHSTQRSCGTSRVVVTLALPTGRPTAPTCARRPSRSSVFQPIASCCSPGWRGTTTLPPSVRTGTARPSIVSDVGSAPAGSPTGKSPPRLERSDSSSVDTRWRRPSETAWVPEPTALSAPGIASGRLTARVAPSPGQTCHTGTSSALSASNTGAVPEIATFHTGEATRCQRSTQVSSARVASASSFTGASSPCQLNSFSWAPRRASSSPSLTTMLELITFSPGSRGTRSSSALPGGERRLTVVRTCHTSPSSRWRSTAAAIWTSGRS